MHGIRRYHRSAAMMAILSGAAIALAQPSDPSFHRLTPPPAFEHSEVTGVSNDGVVVGTVSRFDPYFSQGFRWTVSTGFELLPIPAGQSDVIDVFISDDGQTLLGRALGTGVGIGVIWRDGETIVLRTPPGASIWELFALSGDGQIAVGSVRADRVRRGMRWDAAGNPLPMSDYPRADSSVRVTATNRDGSVLGCFVWEDPGPWYHAFRWTEDEGYHMLGVIPGVPESHANDLSDDGSIIVGHGSTGFHQTAFRWSEHTGFVELGYLPLPGASSASVASAVSGDGSIIVGRSGVIHPFIWDERNGMRNLREIATDLLGHDPTTGLAAMKPRAISADGNIVVGDGKNESDRFEAWVLILPETACYADCDASGELDFFDFLCYQNEFAAGAPEADCDASGSLDFFDFVCFQNTFAAGCP